jgi:hypothetical protein
MKRKLLMVLALVVAAVAVLEVEPTAAVTPAGGRVRLRPP